MSHHKLLLLSVLVLWSGLVAPAQRLRSKADIKWTGHDTEIRNVIENDGYYTSTDGHAFIFYDDGTAVFCHSPFSSSVSSHWPPLADYNGSSWDIGLTGVYKIKNNDIYANLYWENGFFFPKLFIKLYTRMVRYRFHIINRRTILFESEEFTEKEGHVLIYNDTLRFEACDNIPPPHTKMKKKKWLWEKNKQ